MASLTTICQNLEGGNESNTWVLANGKKKKRKKKKGLFLKIFIQILLHFA